MTRRLRAFIASPGDVRAAREIAAQTIERLAQDHARFFDIQPYLWESEALTASGHFQDSLELPSAFDIVILILWSRLGSPLPERTEVREYRGIDGRAPVTGTEWEFEEALKAARTTGRPDLLVYRCVRPAVFEIRDPVRREQQLQQLSALDTFWERHFERENGLAYRTFVEDREFAVAMEGHLRKLLAKHIDSQSLDGSDSRAWTQAPFRGLEPYEFQHAPIYFGQDEPLAKAMLQLAAGAEAQSPFLLLLGASGTGKSSLVRAGILPKLFVPRRISGTAFLRRVFFRPSDAGEREDLFDALARRLVTGVSDLEGLPELLRPGQEVAGLANHLRHSTGEPTFPIGAALGQISTAARQDGRMLEYDTARIVLVVDQLEELFTDERWTAGQRRTFCQLLAGFVRSGLIWVIATMRKDFWHCADETPELVALTQGPGRLELLPPGPSQLSQMIRRPAEAAGLKFELHATTNVPLNEVIAEDVSRQPGALPLLSYLLNQLYRVDVIEARTDTLSYATYQALGRLEGAIATKAEAVLAACSAEIRQALGPVLFALVQLGAADGEVKRAVARRVPLSSFPEGTARRQLIRVLLDANARLLVSDAEQGSEPTVRLAHEALLSRWERAREFVQNNVIALQIRRRIEERYTLWQSLQPVKSSGWRALTSNQPGLLVDIDVVDAQRLLRDHRAELEPHLIAYTELSVRQEKRRRMRSVHILSAITIVVALLAVLAAYAGWTASQKRREAEYEAARALKAQAGMLTEIALSRQHEGHIGEALTLIMESLSGVDPDRAAVTTVDALQKIRAVDYQIGMLEGHRDMLETAVYSPNGSRILTASRDGTARVWDARTARRLGTLIGHTDMVLTASYSPDGRFILTASADKTARVWDAKTLQTTLVLAGHTNWVRCAAYSPDGKQIVTASYDGTARLWDAHTGSLQTVLMGHRNSLEWAAYSPNGSQIVTASLDQTARIWDVRSGRMLRELTGHTERVATAAFSPDGQHVVTASFDQSARIWNARTGVVERVLSGHTDRLESAAYSPDGRRIVTAAGDLTARIWDVETGTPMATLLGHTDLVLSANYSRDGRRIVTASYDKTARVWDADAAGPRLVLAGHTAAVDSAVYSADGRYIVTASRDQTARVWNSGTGALKSVLRGHQDVVDWAAFSPDGSRVVTASFDRSARVWDADTGRQQLLLAGHNDVLEYAAFSPDASVIVTISRLDHTVRLWDPLTGSIRKTIPTGEAQCSNPTFTKDGSTLAVPCSDRLVYLWKMPAVTESGVLRGHGDFVNSVEFTQDGKFIITASDDQTVRTWNAASGAPTHILTGYGSAAYSAVPLGSDRLMLLTGDGIVRVVDASTGTPLAELPSGGPGINWAVLSPDHAAVVTSANDHLARIWALPVTLPLTVEIPWYQAANFDYLDGVERSQFGRLPEPGVRSWPAGASACDGAAAAFYDPDRSSAGVSSSSLNTDTALTACGASDEDHQDSPRHAYETGRVQYAHRQYASARAAFQRASADGYAAADIDLADLLLDPAAGEGDPQRASILYQQAWKHGVPIAAARLGALYESGLLKGSSSDSSIDWYRLGAQQREPTAIGHFADLMAERSIEPAAGDSATEYLLQAFILYACAAQYARLEAWPDEQWSHWRHLRATLARELAIEGQSEAVATAYHAVTTGESKVCSAP